MICTHGASWFCETTIKSEDVPVIPLICFTLTPEGKTDNSKRLLTVSGCGGGIVVSVLAFYSFEPSSNLTSN